ncbi:hypothetical protein Y032_0068g185 [Ancylostoma ceylanicum]|uniref:Nucleolar protein 6 n=1 Tax=Ancylostoma ceylanicum TaxID=53326 RepID=A0A016TYL3_9BILA|nr:hypothetical protein Y032_0068g185 [Ancylostoma ceylanicum]
MKRSRPDDDVDMQSVVKPMTNAFRLQCEDAERDRHAAPEVMVKWEEIAKKVAITLKTAKLKHVCQYKDLESWKKHGVTHPLVQHAAAIAKTTSSVTEYKWAPPEEVVILSESAVDLLCSSSFTIHVFVTLPDSIFGKRDYINLTYPAKRAHYMCSCLIALRKAYKDLEADFLPGSGEDAIFPNIRVSDKTSSGSVLIHFGASESALAKTSRFAPNISNIRASTIYPEITDKDEEATPMFNQRVLRTILEPAMVRRVSTELRHKENIVSALALATRWFRSRGLKEIDDLLLACFMVRLLEENVVVKQQDLLTVLRNFFLAIVNWDTSVAIGFQPDDLEDDVIAAHLAAFPVVFLDGTGYWNVANGISKDSLSLAKADLSRSLSSLGDCLAFDTLFLEQHHFFSSFDHYFRLDLSPENKKLLCKTSDFVVDTIDDSDRLRRFIGKLSMNISECMGERFDNMYIHRLENTEQQTASFLLGFRVKRGWTNPITMGPVATEPSAKAFRLLWKEKTQLRKFADTRICECMVWANTASQAVPHSILQFILVNHFGLPAGCISWRSVFPTGFSSPKDVNTKITTAFASLSAILRSAKGLPLMITNIHGISPYIRDTEPCAAEVLCTTDQGHIEDGRRMPAQRAVPPYTGAVTVHLKLEYSGKWGDTIEGVRQLSAALYIEIGKYLKEKHDLIAVPTMDQLFVVKDGVVFKLVLVLDKILKMLEQRVAEVRASGATRIETSAEGQRLNAWKKQYVHEALLQASLQSFATKHAAFGETVQIVKKWLSIHFMTDAVADLVVEMIVAAAFEHPVLPPPQTPIAAFRRVLQLIVKHNWTARPLFVDFDGAWNEEEIAKLESNFVKMRPVLPPMVVITNEDPVGSRWTRDGPTPLLLKRLIALAKSVLKVLDMNYEHEKAVDLKSALVSMDMSIFDAVIEIFPKMVVRTGFSEKIPVVKDPEALPVVNFDPVDELLYALNAHFQNVALFFWNKYGGDRIGVIWKPYELEVPAKKIPQFVVPERIPARAVRLRRVHFEAAEGPTAPTPTVNACGTRATMLPHDQFFGPFANNW